MKPLILIVLFSLSLFASAQVDKNFIYNSQKAIDIISNISNEFLRYTGQEILIKPYFHSKVDAIKKRLKKKESVTYFELNKMASEILAATPDTHLRMRFSQMGSINNFLDFAIETTIHQNKRVYIATDLKAEKFLINNAPFLTHINGVEIEKLIEMTRKQINHGASKSFFHSRSINYLLNFGFYTHPQDKNIEITLKGYDKKTYLLKRRLLNKKISPPLLPKTEKHEIFHDNIGYFRIKSMLTSESFAKNWLSFMNKARYTDGLIIDLRGNDGGNRKFFKYFFPFFMKSSDDFFIATAGYCRKDPKCHKGANNREMYLIDQFKNDKVKSFLQKQRSLLKTRDQYELGSDYIGPYFHLIKKNFIPNVYQYTNPVVVLIDRQNFSAADAFIGGIKQHKNIVFMGTPTSGGSGASKIYSRYGDYKISQMLSLNPDGSIIEGNSHQPDYLIYPEPTYFIEKTDNTLKKAKMYIKEFCEIN